MSPSLRGRLRFPWSQLWAPAFIGVLALALRLHGIGDKPLWLDEVASLHRASIGFSAMIAESLESKHYPLYFILLWLVGKIGVSPYLLRLPSALFGSIAAALTSVIGREAGGARTGLAAGLLVALSPFDVQYGQEARSYTLVAALILVALLGLLRLARDPAAAAQRLQLGRRPAWPWLAYGLGTAAALDTLNVAVPWLVAANIAALIVSRSFRWNGDDRAGFRRNWWWVQGFILAAWLPFMVLVSFASKGTALEAPGWAPAETWTALWSIIAPVYLDRISAFITYEVMPAAIPGLSVLIAVLALYGAWRLRRRPQALLVIACGAAILPVLLLLISLATPLLVPRYFAWSAAPFFVLAGAGLARLKAWRFGAAMAALLVVGLVNLRPYYKAETKPRWDLVAAQLAAEARPGDVVYFNGWDSYYVASAYAAKSGLDQRGLTLVWKAKDAARFAPGHDLWVVYGRAGQGAMTPPPDYLGLLARLGVPQSDEQIGRYISIQRFAAPDAVALCTGSDACADQNGGAAIGKP